jgi:hypothetical protein
MDLTFDFMPESHVMGARRGFELSSARLELGIAELTDCARRF